MFQFTNSKRHLVLETVYYEEMIYFYPPYFNLAKISTATRGCHTSHDTVFILDPNTLIVSRKNVTFKRARRYFQNKYSCAEKMYQLFARWTLPKLFVSTKFISIFLAVLLWYAIRYEIHTLNIWAPKQYKNAKEVSEKMVVANSCLKGDIPVIRRILLIGDSTMGELFISLSKELYGFQLNHCDIKSLDGNIKEKGRERDSTRTLNKTPRKFFRDSQSLRYPEFILRSIGRRNLFLNNSLVSMRHVFPHSEKDLHGLLNFNENLEMTELTKHFKPDTIMMQSGIHDFHCLHTEKIELCKKPISKIYWKKKIYKYFPEENCLAQIAENNPCPHLANSSTVFHIANEHAKVFRKRLKPVEDYFRMFAHTNVKIYVKPNVGLPCGWNREEVGSSWIRRNIQDVLLTLVNEQWKQMCDETTLCSYIDINTDDLSCSDGWRDGFHFLNLSNCKNGISRSMSKLTVQIAHKICLDRLQ